MNQNAFKEAFFDSSQAREVNKNKNLDNSEIKVSFSIKIIFTEFGLFTCFQQIIENEELNKVFNYTNYKYFRKNKPIYPDKAQLAIDHKIAVDAANAIP